MAEDQSAFDYVKRMFGGGSPAPSKAQPAPVSQAPLSPDAEQRAKEEEARMVAAAGLPPAPRQPMASPSGLGMVAIQPNQEEIYIYPEEDQRGKFDKSTSNRAKAKAAMAIMLADPKYQRLPAHVRDADKAAYESLIDLEIPAVKSFDEENPSAKEFAKSIMNPYQKRQSFVEALRGQVSLINNTFKKYGPDSNEAANELVPKLMGMLKLYNSALAGTSDALSGAEVERLTPELNPYLFNPKKALQVGGKVVGSDIQKFKSKLEDLHDILLNESNSAFNTMAAMSSPEYAAKSLGFEHKRHFTENVVPRFDKKIPKRVATGALDYAGFIKQRQAQFEQELPQAEATKTQILNSSLPQEEKYRLLNGLRNTFNARTGRDLDVPEEFLAPRGK
jgi:hypothetical protein